MIDLQKSPASEKAVQFLLMELSDSAVVASAALFARASERGISKATMQRTKAALRISPIRRKGSWWWALPKSQDAHPIQDAQTFQDVHVVNSDEHLSCPAGIEDAHIPMDAIEDSDTSARERFDERASIMEFDGGIARQDAERCAWRALPSFGNPRRSTIAHLLAKRCDEFSADF